MTTTFSEWANTYPVPMTALKDERDALLAWQQEAVQTLIGWQRCYDELPATFRPAGARQADCVFAYLDHLRTEVATLRPLGGE